MIGSLRGVVLDRFTQSVGGEVLLEVGGVGYRVAVPTATLAVAATGGPLFLHVHTHVRDDAIVLYGFATREERVCFEALIAVHGVGPSLALAILSVHSPAALQRIVVSDDVESLTLVPGIGRKTGLRLLLDLRAKLDILDVGDGLSLVGGPPDSLADVRAALSELGYGADEIRQALRGMAVEDGAGTPELLRLALRNLAGAR